VLNDQRKFGSKIFSHYTDIVIFVLGYFNLNHPVQIYSTVSQKHLHIFVINFGKHEPNFNNSFTFLFWDKLQKKLE